MANGKPRWRQVFDKVERVVGNPLEDVADSKRFVEVMAVGLKVRRVAGGTVSRVVHGVTGKVLHAVNIPTRDDLKKVSSHVSTLSGEIRVLEQNQRSGGASAPARRPVAARSTGQRAVKSVPPIRRPSAADRKARDTGDD